jgi:hypothetical protein
VTMVAPVSSSDTSTDGDMPPDDGDMDPDGHHHHHHGHYGIWAGWRRRKDCKHGERKDGKCRKKPN